MRRFVALLVAPVVLLLGAVAVWLAPAPAAPRFDVVEANDFLAQVRATWPRIEATYSGDWTIVAGGSVVASSGDPIVSDLEAARRGAFGFDIVAHGRVVGRAWLGSGQRQQWATAWGSARRLGAGVLGLAGVGAAAWAAWAWARLLRPFRRLEQFAADVGAGRLDAPLRVDRGQAFGAFTSSFDLMRTELAAAREAAAKAEESKRDLVAQLSHDLRTPVATILANAELLALKEGDAVQQQRLDAIAERARLVDSLIDELSAASDDRLDALPVVPEELPTPHIASLLRAADATGALEPFQLAEAIVFADPKRLAQILDNLLGNAAKYAGTRVVVDSGTTAESWWLRLTDSGPGVRDEEVASLVVKRFRGSNAAGIPGSGLGLYTSAWLAERMGGDLTLANADGCAGFVAQLTLPLA